MQLDGKLKAGVKDILDKIVVRNFDEEDIELLLIRCREFIQRPSLLRDIADFIAHPSRKKGEMYDYLYYIFLKIKYSNGLINWPGKQKYVIDIENIEEVIFEKLFVHSIELGEIMIHGSIPSVDIIKDNYVKIGKFYKLKKGSDKSFMEDIKNAILNNVKLTGMDCIGMVDGILFILDNLHIVSGLESIDLNIKAEIGICIMSLLHHRKFEFPDNIELFLEFDISAGGDFSLLYSFSFLRNVRSPLVSSLISMDYNWEHVIHNPNGFHLVRNEFGDLIFQSYT